MFTICQGIIIQYTDPRSCSVLQLPDNYLLTNVRLPHTLSSQFKPLPRSVVLVASEDSYKNYIVAVLRDPEKFLETGEGVRGSTAETASFLQPGEIYIEAAGVSAPEQGVSGTGGSLFMGNDGTVSLNSGKRKESIVLGGEDTDDDGEVIITADNGFFESNINPITQIRSTYRFDIDNNLVLGNFLTTVLPAVPPLEVPVSQLTMSTLGEIGIENNTVAGTPVNKISMTPTGTLSLEALVDVTVEATSSIALDSSANISIDASANIALQSSANITLDSGIINLNSGTFGVARIQDTVTSNITSDPAWWAFWSTLSGLIAALPTTPLDGGATLKAGLSALFATIPVTIVSTITTGSATVKAGN